MTRTRLDIESQTDLPVSEANLLRLGNNSVVDDLHNHSKLVLPSGSPDPALHIDSDGKTRGLKLPVETTTACNANYEVGDLFIYNAVSQGRFYLALKDENGSAKAVLLGTDVTLT